jgi:hypothetical protein
LRRNSFQLKVKLLFPRIFSLLLAAQFMPDTVYGAPLPDATPKSDTGSDYTLIHFPQTLSLGVVYVGVPKNLFFHSRESDVMYPPAKGWRRWANAYRDVKVPKGLYVRLAIPQGNHDAVVALKSLKPDNAIQSLQLGGTDFNSNDWESIRHFSDLRELVLGANNFSDQSVANLKYFPKLEMLDLSRTAISDQALKPVAELKQLHTLAVGNDKIHDAGVKMLGTLPKLCRFDADQCPIGEGIKAVLTPHLYGIILRGTRANDETIKYLASKNPHQLSYITLSGCKISDKCIPDLLKLTSLRSIIMEDTPISIDGLHRLKRGLPKCRIRAGESRGEHAIETQ